VKPTPSTPSHPKAIKRIRIESHPIRIKGRPGTLLLTFAVDAKTDKTLSVHSSKFPSTHEDMMRVIDKLERFGFPQTVVVDRYSAFLLWNLLVVFQEKKVKVLFSPETNSPVEVWTKKDLKEITMPNPVMRLGDSSSRQSKVRGTKNQP
jgi:MinD superfamily P-loop ATPase